MVSEAPPFWWKKRDWRAFALYPFSLAYAHVARRRLNAARREPADLPVLCIGNFTVGGAGKTPVAIAFAEAAKRRMLKPGFLSRGHGGSLSHPRLVDAAHDSARHVGDEPILLAAHAPTAVGADRAAGARMLGDQGCTFLIMDDGFQSGRILFDFALMVVDARRGIGNGHVIPGGPMRAPLVDQMRRTDAVLRVGEGEAANEVIRQAARAGRPVYHAHARPRPGSGVSGRRFLAFAGIGDPEKFYDTLEAAGAWISATRSFPDHHFYSEDEIADLVASARGAGVDLVTTAKDAARLRGSSSASSKALLSRLFVLEIDMAFDAESMPDSIIDETLRNWRERRLGR